MSDELGEKSPPAEESVASVPPETNGAEPSSEEPAPASSESALTLSQKLLLASGILVILVGTGALVWLGPTIGRRPPPAQPKGDERLQLRTLLQKWESLTPDARQAAVPELIAAFRQDDENNRVNAMLALGNAGGEVVAPLAAVLQDEDFNVRFYSAWALGRIGPPAAAALPALLEMRKDLIADVRRRAVYAIGRIKPPAATGLPVLIGMLGDEDPEVCTTAVEGLAGYGKEAVPALVKALGGDSAQVRRHCMRALAAIGPDAVAAMPALRPWLLQPGSDLQADAAAALARIGKPAIPVLVEALQTDPATLPAQVVLGFGDPWALLVAWRDFPDIHGHAVKALADIGPDAIPVLLTALHNPNADIRANAAGALGSVGYADERVVTALAAVLRDPDVPVRNQATAALLRDLSADPRLMLPGLRQALEDRDAAVRANAVKVLGALGPVALPVLLAALKDPEVKTQLEAVKALDALAAEKEEMLAAMVPLLQDENALLRQNVVRMLYRGGNAAVPHLLSALKDKDAKVRQWAVLALGLPELRPDADPTIAALGQALEDEDTLVRAGAATALVRFGAQAVPLLRKVVKDKNPKVRLAVARAMHLIGPSSPMSWTTVEPLAHDPDAEVRLAATAALERFGDLAVPLLIAALQDKDEKVWDAARKALLKVDVPAKKLLPVMAKALTEGNKSTRQGVAFAMSRFNADAVPYLVEALKDRERIVQYVAVDALDTIGPEARKPPAVRALVETAISPPRDAGDKPVFPTAANFRRRAIDALLRMHGIKDPYEMPLPDAVPHLLKVLEDPEADVRWSVTQTLAAIGPPANQAIPALKKALSDSNFSVSQGARYALQRIEGK
jgi:HEAT repeat protein